MSSRCFSLTEVATHNTSSDCWVIIHGDVIDVTSFLDSHPGGASVLCDVDRAGSDVTFHYDNIGHSKNADEIISSLRIGVISNIGRKNNLTISDIEVDHISEDDVNETTSLINDYSKELKTRDNVSSSHDYSAMWHANRRKAIRRDHPEVAALHGHNNFTVVIGLCTVFMHAYTCCYVQKPETSWFMTLILAYTVGAVCKMYQFAVNHDLCHNTAGCLFERFDLLKRSAMQLLTLPSVGGATHAYYEFQHLGHHVALGAQSLGDLGGPKNTHLNQFTLADIRKVILFPDSDGDMFSIGTLSMGRLLLSWDKGDVTTTTTTAAAVAVAAPTVTSSTVLLSAGGGVNYDHNVGSTGSTNNNNNRHSGNDRNGGKDDGDEEIACSTATAATTVSTRGYVDAAMLKVFHNLPAFKKLLLVQLLHIQHHAGMAFLLIQTLIVLPIFSLPLFLFPDEMATFIRTYVWVLLPNNQQQKKSKGEYKDKGVAEVELLLQQQQTGAVETTVAAAVAVEEGTATTITTTTTSTTTSTTGTTTISKSDNTTDTASSCTVTAAAAASRASSQQQSLSFSDDVLQFLISYGLRLGSSVGLHSWLWFGSLIYLLFYMEAGAIIDSTSGRVVAHWTYSSVIKGYLYLYLSELFLYGFAVHPFMGYFLGVHRSGGDGFNSIKDRNSSNNNNISSSGSSSNGRDDESVSSDTTTSVVSNNNSKYDTNQYHHRRSTSNYPNEVRVDNDHHNEGQEGMSPHLSFQNNCQPTMSTYGLLSALFSMNLTHHVEHHDFPGVPWSRLPELTRLAPEYYNQLESSPDFVFTIKQWTKHSGEWGYACQ